MPPTTNGLIVKGSGLPYASFAIVQVQPRSSNYQVEAFGSNAGSVGIRLTNRSGGALAEAVGINFAIFHNVVS